ncbi:MAG TPA: ribosome biogenesis GTP-binding protein YsxC, partial [Acholeplasmatales bacterium]|nr:ribosome biogenesis GTP-binding protein YsxC [Acholeplasmatales bacterium]
KSSFINALTNQKKLAYTSSKPGKTRFLNFYLIDHRFFIVDAPGYGYAAQSHETRESFKNYVKEYLFNNQNLQVAFLLVDTKVGPTEDDVLMCEFLRSLHLKIVVIATKSDKVGNNLLFARQKAIKEKLNIGENDLIMTSSVKKIGFEKVREMLK